MSMSVVAMGFGAVTSADGASNNAKAQQQTLNYEAAVANNNKTIADYQASVALQNGQIQEQTQQLKTASMMGDQRAALAANGVDLGTGSATEILATTKFMGQRDALTIRDNAARTAWAYQNQGQGYKSEANADAAISGSISPGVAATTSLLGSATQAEASWYNYNKSKNG